jgi:predicted MFS family arabinose efflux permease
VARVRAGRGLVPGNFRGPPVDLSGVSEELGEGRSNAPVTVLATAAMTISMLQLYVLGALGPVLVHQLRLAQWQLGALVAADFAIAAALSVPAGAIVDRLGPRRTLVALFAVSAVALGTLAAARDGWWVLVAVLVGSAPQALSNPATNNVILARVPGRRRGSVTGWKQSGVQIGAFIAGLPLAWLASVTSWRAGVAALAVLAAGAALAAGRLRVPPTAASRSGTRASVSARVSLLAVFSVALGAGVSAVNTYLALYAHADLHLSDAVAGTLVAVLGVAGIAGRVLWSRRAGASADPATVLAFLPAGAAVAALAWACSGDAVPVLAWVGAVLIGLCGVAANAVSMVVVMRSVPIAVAGRAAALVSAGYFGGFALGPSVGGALVAAAGYRWLWTAVCAAFLAACAAGRLVAGTGPLRGGSGS